MSINRREFLSGSISGGIAFAIGCSRPDSTVSAAPDTGVWSDNFQINPAISNRKVVCCHDDLMVSGDGTAATFLDQNKSVDNSAICGLMPLNI